MSSVTVQILNILNFVVTPSLPQCHLCSCSIKATIDNAKINGCGSIPTKLYIQKQAEAGTDLPVFVIDNKMKA